MDNYEEDFEQISQNSQQLLYTNFEQTESEQIVVPFQLFQINQYAIMIDNGNNQIKKDRFMKKISLINDLENNEIFFPQIKERKQLKKLGQENQELKQQILNVNSQLDILIESLINKQADRKNDVNLVQKKMRNKLEIVRKKLTFYDNQYQGLKKRSQQINENKSLTELQEQKQKKEKMIEKLKNDINKAKLDNTNKGKNLFSNSLQIEEGTYARQIDELQEKIFKQQKKNKKLLKKICKNKSEEKVKEEGNIKLEEQYKKLSFFAQSYNIIVQSQKKSLIQEEHEKLLIQKQHLQNQIQEFKRINKRNLKLLNKQMQENLNKKEEISSKLDNAQNECKKLIKVSAQINKQRVYLSLEKSQRQQNFSSDVGFKNKTHLDLYGNNNHQEFNQLQNSIFSQYSQTTRSSLNPKPEITSFQKKKKKLKSQTFQQRNVQQISQIPETNVSEVINSSQQGSHKLLFNDENLQTQFTEETNEFGEQQKKIYSRDYSESSNSSRKSKSLNISY